MDADIVFPNLGKGPELEEGKAFAPRFNADGLISAIVIDTHSREILMLAHMNAMAIDRTLQTGQSHFWSRSRKELWHKGATSGDYQSVKKIRVDCDQDAVILEVETTNNVSCHTGRESCFYREIQGKSADDCKLKSSE